MDKSNPARLALLTDLRSRLPSLIQDLSGLHRACRDILHGAPGGRRFDKFLGLAHNEAYLARYLALVLCHWYRHNLNELLLEARPWFIRSRVAGPLCFGGRHYACTADIVTEVVNDAETAFLGQDSLWGQILLALRAYPFDEDLPTSDESPWDLPMVLLRTWGLCDQPALLMKELSNDEDVARLIRGIRNSWQNPTPQEKGRTLSRLDLQLGRHDLDSLRVEVEWESNRVVNLLEDGSGPAATTADGHSPDFRSVRWDGEPYCFTATQAACIKLLWEAMEKGAPELGEQTLLQHPTVDVTSTRLRDIFRSAGQMHPCWNKLIVRGDRKGTFRLGRAKNPKKGSCP
jgi:hypothetical protein